MSVTRNRIRLELGKGIEALRHEEVSLYHGTAGSLTYVGIIGPFETDVDVMEVAVTPGVKPATNGSNALDVFNGTVSGAKKIITTLADASFTAQVPVDGVIAVANRRVLAGTPISVQAVFAGNDSAAPASLRVRVGYDISIDGYANSKMTTYGGYTDGQ